MQGPYSQERSKRRNISRSAGSGGGCEGARGHSRTFTCTFSLSLSLVILLLPLSLPGGRPGPRRRRGKESVMRRDCSMALRDMELAQPRRSREPGGTRRYRETAGGTRGTRPCLRPGGSGGAGLWNRPVPPSATAALALVPVPRSPRHPRLSSGAVTPQLSPPPTALSCPHCHLHPSVPCSPGTVTRVSDCHPRHCQPPSCAHCPLALSPL